ncbi:hypothetical protein ACUNV4_27845 [Granulosicoccus sp. 3-233]|uniref:hypothetical protein n=1 Tax=Granulosicoccus sp. 3-233 TaxID=3417969 RepID=UPI003D32EEBA
MAVQSDRSVVAMVAIWLSLSGGALYALADYGSSAGQAAPAPSQWPASVATGITPSADRATVVLFAHPLCPCTRATLVEFESLTNRLYGLFDLHVLFFEPADPSAMPEVWGASDLRQLASALPGTRLHADVDGQLARHFGAYTSGQVLLYDTTGALRFGGGITPSRGHTGSNPGRGTLISTILSDSGIDPLAPILNPVFGCGLLDSRDDDRKSTQEPLVFGHGGEGKDHLSLAVSARHLLSAPVAGQFS